MTAILSSIYDHSNMTGDEYDHFYLMETEKPGFNAFLRFFTYFILLNTMIPISLIVTLEIVKVIQGYFISRDEDMYV